MARDAARSFADPESVRILDLYKSSVRESAGKLGAAWLERTPPSLDRPKLTLDPQTTTSRLESSASPTSTPPAAPRPARTTNEPTRSTTSAPRPRMAFDHPPEDEDVTTRDTLIDSWGDIPVDLELTPTSSGEREAVGPRHYDEEIVIDAMDAPPAAQRASTGRRLAPALRPTVGSYVRLMLVAGASGFILITALLFGAEYAGMPAHVFVQKAWQAILALGR